MSLEAGNLGAPTQLGLRFQSDDGDAAGASKPQKVAVAKTHFEREMNWGRMPACQEPREVARFTLAASAKVVCGPALPVCVAGEGVVVFCHRSFKGLDAGNQALPASIARRNLSMMRLQS